jgi:hypothetical protein
MSSSGSQSLLSPRQPTAVEGFQAPKRPQSGPSAKVAIFVAASRHYRLCFASAQIAAVS